MKIGGNSDSSQHGPTAELLSTLHLGSDGIHRGTCWGCQEETRPSGEPALAVDLDKAYIYCGACFQGPADFNFDFASFGSKSASALAESSRRAGNAVQPHLSTEGSPSWTSSEAGTVHTTGNLPPPGTSFRIAESLGIELVSKEGDKKRVGPCPLPSCEGKSESTFVVFSRNNWKCLRCGEQGWSKKLCEHLGAQWSRFRQGKPKRKTKRKSGPATAAEIEAFWALARSERIAPPEVRAFLKARGLEAALSWDRGILGWSTHEERRTIASIRWGRETRIALACYAVSNPDFAQAVQGRSTAKDGGRKILGAGPTSGSAFMSPGLIRALKEREVIDLLYVAEGLIDTLTLIAHLGVNARVLGIPGTSLVDSTLRALPKLAEGARVILTFDADTAGSEATRKASALIAGAGYQPWAVSMPDGNDINDVWVSGGVEGLNAVLERPIRITPSEEEVEHGVRHQRPRIRVDGGDLALAVPLTATAIQESTPPTKPRVYFQAGRLVEVIPGSPQSPTLIQEIASNRFAVIAGQSADFWRSQDDGPPIKKDCPQRLAKALLENPGGHEFPLLDAICNGPLLRTDGSIWQTPGYDHVSRSYFDPRGLTFPVIPQHPTKEQAQESLQLLKDLVKEVAVINEGARSVLLAALITSVTRLAYPLAPAFHFDATQQATGKTTAALACASLASGVGHGSLATFPAYSETELRKSLMSHLISGRIVIIWDNLPEGYVLTSPTLCRVLTATSYSDRILGKSFAPTVDPRVTIITTGNNVAISGDLTTRIIPCHLDRGDEAPETHEYSRDLIADVLNNRAGLVSAALIISRAYIAAGCPDVPGASCRMPDWSRFVRQPLIWLGLPDPMGAQEAAKSADPAHTNACEFLANWDRILGRQRVTARQLLDRLGSEVVHQEEALAMRDSLADWARKGPNQLTPRSISDALRPRLGRRLEGRVLESDGGRSATSLGGARSSGGVRYHLNRYEQDKGASS